MVTEYPQLSVLLARVDYDSIWTSFMVQLKSIGYNVAVSVCEETFRGSQSLMETILSRSFENVDSEISHTRVLLGSLRGENTKKYPRTCYHCLWTCRLSLDIWTFRDDLVGFWLPPCWRHRGFGCPHAANIIKFLQPYGVPMGARGRHCHGKRPRGANLHNRHRY